METSVLDIMSKSKERLNNMFFRIKKNDDKYEVIQYVGPHKSASTMLAEGWNKHLYLDKYITPESPVLDINDYKSEDGIFLVKKTEEDLLKESFEEIIEYYEMNRSLVMAVSSLKNVLQLIGIDFMKIKSIEDISTLVKNQINSLSLPTIEKANLLFDFADAKIQVFDELEKMNIESPVNFFSEKFKQMMMIVK